jgi:hypothetical protein
MYIHLQQVEPQRSIAAIRLPCAGLPAICALQHPAAGSGNAFEGGGAASSLSGQSDVATLPEDADEVCLVLCGHLLAGKSDAVGEWRCVGCGQCDK